MNQAAPSLHPGFVALHGNRAEDLAQTVIAWLQRQPLGPLEEEVVLVQSSGMAEWFKMEMARSLGICSATRVELPGRFIWRTFRQVLGARAVPRQSALDKLPMTWRLMQLLPELLQRPSFAPVDGYLEGDEAERPLQLASRLADLFDQYQNYRSDWLEDWTAGRDQLSGPHGQQPLPTGQRWQAELWRALQQSLAPEQQRSLRPLLQSQVLAALGGEESFSGRVARRVIVYGMCQLPGATLQLLAALSRHSQVILAVPNPCRYDWGDIIEGRELLRSEYRRLARRNSLELSALPLQDMHLHAHPLLAAWGRQSRDFIRQLDAVEESCSSGESLEMLRVERFEPSPENAGTPLLQRLQNRVLELEPQRDESTENPLPAGDTSVTFQIAHSPVRELEILQDLLLQWLAEPAGESSALQARDIVVMVPDIERMAPAIRAVFGQYPRHDARHIPFDIADLSARASSPLVSAVEWLLRLPGERCGLSELQDLWQVPALARRFGLAADQHARLCQWMAGSGIRWGLHQAHREDLGLGACGDQNSAWFGLQRMLLGYASGSLAELPGQPGWDDTEPYAEVGGLDAELAGILAHLLQRLDHWWQLARQPQTPTRWAEAGRELLSAMFQANDESDQKVLQALGDALQHWTDACSEAGFAQPLDLAAFRMAWLDGLEQPTLERRFRAGGITFCTLMPMRAVPFEVVCLLGMNDGDYPRKSQHNDFDLMQEPGMARPGDRSRRQDDRQLMLEALLSARRRLCISWTGHSVRDNSEQPPSVLVAQLRDHIAAVWGPAALQARTTSHPLQSFSRRYFEADTGLQTFASEWRSLHDNTAAASATSDASRAAQNPQNALPACTPDNATPLTLQRLIGFLRNPVRVFFRERLGVVFEADEEAPADEEAFTLTGLGRYALLREQLRDWPEAPASAGLAAQIPARLQTLRRSGALPMHGFGDLQQESLENTLQYMAQSWQQAGARFAYKAARQPVHLEHQGLLLQDWIDGLCQSAPGTATGPEVPGEVVWLQREAGKVCDKKGGLRPDKLLGLWIHLLAGAASGLALHGILVAQDATIEAGPIDPVAARQILATLLQTWRDGMQQPLPLPLKTGLAVARGLQTGKDSQPERVYEGNEDGSPDDFANQLAEVSDCCLARQFPDYETLHGVPAPDGSGSYLEQLAEQVLLPLLKWAEADLSITGRAA